MGKDTFTGILTRMERDASGNTLAIAAAAMMPLVGMIGGGVDMSRMYLDQISVCNKLVTPARSPAARRWAQEPGQQARPEQRARRSPCSTAISLRAIMALER